MCYWQLWRISKILKIESNSQLDSITRVELPSCDVSQRYSKLKAIHNGLVKWQNIPQVVTYLKDTQNWKQFTTFRYRDCLLLELWRISKILKIESNSQQRIGSHGHGKSCDVSQRYSKLKAIHNRTLSYCATPRVVTYLKDTQNWKQFTTRGNKTRNEV